MSHGRAYKLESTGDDRSSEDIGKGESLANKEGVVGEVLLEDTDGLDGLGCGLIDGLLVVGSTSGQRAEPSTEGGEDLGVGERQPSEDGGVVLLGLSEEGGLLVLGSD